MAQAFDQLAVARGRREGLQVRRYAVEALNLAIGQDRLDGVNVVDHVAIADRAGAAGIVTGHTAKGRAASGRDIDREKQTRRLEAFVQSIQHHTRLYRDAPLVQIEIENSVEILAEVDDQGFAHGLAAL